MNGLVLCGIAAVLLRLLTLPAAASPLISIDDTTEGTPTVVISEIPDAVVVEVPEQVIVTGTFVNTQPFDISNFTLSVRMLEPNGLGAVSDFVQLVTSTCTAGSCPFTLYFISDGAANPPGLPFLNVRDITENGLFQELFGPTGVHDAFGSSIRVLAASEVVEAVPEPGSLAILAFGLIGLRVSMRRGLCSRLPSQ